MVQKRLPAALERLVRHDHLVKAIRHLPDRLGFRLPGRLSGFFRIFFRGGSGFLRLVRQLFDDRGRFLRFVVRQLLNRSGMQQDAGRGEQDREKRK